MLPNGIIMPGIYSNKDLSNEAYHADRDYISSSGLKLIPARLDEFYATYHMSHKRPVKSEALKFGGGFHSAILEPDVFPLEYVIEPKVNKRTKAGQEELAAFYKEVEDSGKTILTPDDMDLIRSMRDSVMQHPIAGPVVRGAVSEQSFFIQEDNGLWLKVRTDAKKNNIIVDLKSTDDVYNFQYSNNRYGLNFQASNYNFSAAMYLDVVSKVTNEPHEKFVYIVVQKKYPYTVAVMEMDAEAMADGKRKYQESREALLELKQTNDFAQINVLSLPE